MADCKICTAYQKNELILLYEDATVMAYLEREPAAKGHVKVCTKSHVAKFRELPNNIASYAFFTASFAAMAVFDQLGAQGTNIIINEGAATAPGHLCIDVIPRKMDDGLNFLWEPKQLSEEDMAKAFDRLKDKAFFIGKERPPPPSPVNLDQKAETKEESTEDYLVRHIRRIP